MSGREGTEAWRLRELTELETLPDYQEAQFGWRGRGAGPGPDVEAGGQPKGPRSTPTATRSSTPFRRAGRPQKARRPAVAVGPRQEGKRGASQQADVDWRFANFLMQQFDVQTMRR